VQQIGNELVVALEIHIADVEENNTVAGLDAFAQNFDRPAVPFEKRPKMLGHQGSLTISLSGR